MSDSNTIEQKVRAILKQHSALVVDAITLQSEADLYNAGMNSLATVNVMLALEDAFDIEFPDSMLNKKVFGSISAISEAVLSLTTA